MISRPCNGIRADRGNLGTWPITLHYYMILRHIMGGAHSPILGSWNRATIYILSILIRRLATRSPTPTFQASEERNNSPESDPASVRGSVGQGKPRTDCHYCMLLSRGLKNVGTFFTDYNLVDSRLGASGTALWKAS